MEVEDDELNDEASVRDNAWNNDVGEIEGDKGKNDDGNDDASSFVVFVVTAGVAAIIADVKDCTFTSDDDRWDDEPVEQTKISKIFQFLLRLDHINY